jgi:hypothetical protein
VFISFANDRYATGATGDRWIPYLMRPLATPTSPRQDSDTKHTEISA